ncbi:MAG TPA: M48 family metalloprotease [Kineosporiaceae bacterium]|nr:M48 family metalloprotease [Kineosporiaceae bacterium]
MGRIAPATTATFVLIGLVLAAAGLFAAQWLLVFRWDGWVRQGQSCSAAVAGGAPVSTIKAFLSCTDRVNRLQVLAAACGPLVLLVAGLAGAVLAPTLITRTRQVSAPRNHALPDAWAAVMDAAGLPQRGRPRVVVDGAGGRDRSPQAYGLPGRYGVAVGLRIALNAEAAAKQAQPLPVANLRVLAHELGHIAMRDVMRTYLTRAAGLAFAVLVPVPVIFDAYGHGLTFPVGWRLGVVTVLVAWAFVRVMRIREHDADLFAARLLATMPSAADSARILEPGGNRDQRVRRKWHPSCERRQQVLDDPDSLSRWWWVDALVAATAAGLALTEIPLQVDVLLPAHTVTYAAVAAVVLLPTLAVPWLSAPRPTDGPSATLRPGLVLAGVLTAGLAFGSVLTPHGATAWWTAFHQAPNYGADIRWWNAQPAVRWGLLAALVVTGGLLGLGTMALRRRADGNLLVLGGLSVCGGLAVGEWFLLTRLAPQTQPADFMAEVSGSGAGAFALAGMLVGLVLVWAGNDRRRLGIAAALSGLLLLTGVTAGPRATHPHSTVLGGSEVHLPSSTSLYRACPWIEATAGTFKGGWGASPDAGAIATYLAANQDPLLRAAGSVLAQAVASHDLTLQATAQRAATRRCVIAYAS